MIAPIQATDLKNQLHSASLSMPDTPEARNPDQPMSFHADLSATRTFQHEFPSHRRVIENCYDSLKTNPLRFENQVSRKLQEIIQDISVSEAPEQGELPSAERYFAALEGPELEELKVVRVNFFRGFRFSLAWWAYTVPMASASIATIIYAGEVDSLFMKILSVALSFISALTCLGLVISTIFHAFVLHNLFPNDIAIAITLKKLS